jgi:16S rRNA (adenine1518-N6/adenine1519-N6)-dimethyltransferase
MAQYGIAPLKKLGQNFLVDGNIADKIALAAAPEGAFVLEIGPGFGALTSRLLARANKVAAYEIDAGLARALSALYADEPRFHLFHKDFLKADLEEELGPLVEGRDVYVAANLPYYITSPCIMALLTSKINVKRITVMVQKEVADRLCASPGGRDFGVLSAAVDFFSTPQRLFGVSSTCFFPKPEVESAVAQMEITPRTDADFDAYLDVVKALFAMRRKTVKSNLRTATGLGLEQAGEVLKAAGIDENARAEMLSVKDFISISYCLKK